MKKLPDPRPYIGDELKDDIGAIHALQALAAGKASPDQQKYAVRYITTVLGMCNQMTYCPNDRDTAFAEGRRWVAHQITLRIDTDITVLTATPKEIPHARSRRSSS